MANRYPLIANSSANQIQELASSDNIDLTGNYIVGVVGVNASGIITATSFSGSGASLIGIAATDNIITSTASTMADIYSTGIITATSFVGDITGDVTGNASGLSGSPDITINNLVGVAATINSSGLDVVGIASVGVAITMYGSSGIVSATSFYGDGQYLDNVSASGGGETDITSCLFI